VIAIIAAKFITPGSFPGETGRAVDTVTVGKSKIGFWHFAG
jgi:hypothetical protein